MDEDADLKQDPSPTRICLELLGNQLDEIERRQSEWDGRHKRWESEHTRVLTQLVQRLESLSSRVSEAGEPAPEFEAIRFELARLQSEQGEAKLLLKGLKNAKLNPTDPALLELRHRLDRALEALQHNGVELEALRQNSQNSSAEPGPSVADINAIRHELARIQGDQAETKALLKSLQQARLSPDDPALLELRLRMDQATEALAQTGVELASLRRQSLPAKEDSTHSTIAFEAWQSELRRVHNDQAETKSLLKSLQQAGLNPEDPVLQELRQRLDQALALLERTGTELESMRQSPPVAVSSEEGPAALESVRLELAQLHRDHHETKTLLQHLQEARSNPEDSAHLELRQRLDQALALLERTGTELESLRQSPPVAVSAEEGPAALESVRLELAQLHRDHHETKIASSASAGGAEQSRGLRSP